MLFENADWGTTLICSTYKNLKEPITNELKDMKFKKTPMLRALVDTFEDNFDSALETIIKKGHIMYLPNGKLNDQVIQEAIEKCGDNAKDNILSGLKKVAENLNEEKKKRKILNDKL